MKGLPVSFVGLVPLAFALFGCGDKPAQTAVAPPESRAEAPLPPSDDIRNSTPKPPESIAAVAKEYEALDPKADGWEGEAFYESAKHQIDPIKAHLLGEGDEAACLASLAPGAEATLLRPARLMETAKDSAITVRRAAKDAPAQPAKPLLEALRHFVAPTVPFSERTLYFKLYRVDLAPAQPEITALVTATGRDGGRCLQINSTWTMIWTKPADAPLLVSAKALDYEEVESRAGEANLLADCTVSVLGKNASYRERLVPSLDHWAENLHEMLSPEIVGYAGLAVADVNGDSLDDLYLCHTGGLPNQLFLREPDGTLRDASRESGADLLEKTHSALFVDLDNDGDQDLGLIIDMFLLLLSNDGAGHFKKEKLLRMFGDPMALSSADYDNDGDLDIYICNYGNPWSGFGALEERFPLPSYYDANNGGPNALLENKGGWEFEDATEKAGLNVNNRRWSLASCWEDYDNDGDSDLFVANDFGRKNLYRNELIPSGKATFTDVAAAAGAEDISPGMSASWADYDNDGFMDIYASNMFSGAGSRITAQGKFQPTATAEEKGKFQRSAKGNTLLRNNGDGTFSDVSDDSGVTVGRWAWASIFADMNNDGAEDILVTNGFLTQSDQLDL